MVAADISQQTAGRRMAYPDKPQQQFSYTAFQQGQGDNSFPGTQLDNDLANQRASIEATIEFLRSALRSDGRVANASIGREQLAADISLGFDPPQAWTAGGVFNTGNTVFIDNRFYIATQDHTAQVDFADDLAAGRWTLLVDFQEATTDAEAARDAAQTAQGLAEGARDDAQTARTGSETARDAAQTAQGLAEGARDDAQTARTGAQTAQSLAEGARDDAQTARTGSETARDKAEAWASEAEDTPVETSPDRFSAEHWARKAAASAEEIATSTAGGISYTPAAPRAASNVQAMLDALDAAPERIGEPFFLFDNITGVSAPDNSGTAKYIRLTAGQSGPGGYNEGLLTNESVSGSAPLVEATAEIATGPLAGQIVPLINTEEAFLRARETSGVLQMDQIQKLVGEIAADAGELVFSTGVFDGAADLSPQGRRVATADNTSPRRITFDASGSPDARVSSTTSGETRSKNRSATAYMRIV